MQFRLTLSEDDLVESKILKALEPLNPRRRSEYLRKLLARGYMADIDDMSKIRNFDPPVEKPKAEIQDASYNQSSAPSNVNSSGANEPKMLPASMLSGLFESQRTAGGAKLNEGIQE